MNDDPTHHGDADDDGPDERVAAALRDVPAMPPALRRAHLDAALHEYDRLHDPAAAAPLAPVVPLRRRSARILQVAAAIVLVVGGLAVAVRVGVGTSDQSADTASTESTASSGSGDDDGDMSEAGSAPAPEAVAGGGAAGFDEQTQDATARSAPDDAAKQGPVTTLAPALGSSAAPPRVPSGPVPGSLGDYATDEDLRVDVTARATSGTLPAGVDPEVGCPAPAEVGQPATGTSADVAGQRRIVWVGRNPDGSPGAIVLVDASTCRPVG